MIRRSSSNLTAKEDLSTEEADRLNEILNRN